MNLESVIARADIWRGKDFAPKAHGVSSGFEDLDELLPERGWPRGALTEILTEREGVGAIRLLMPAMARLSDDKRWLALIAPPYIPYAPAFAGLGIDLSRILVVHDREGRDKLWALEQALRSGTCSAVFAWLPYTDTGSLRRLQLAAEAGDTMGVVFRSQRALHDVSPAALRLKLTATNKGVNVKVLKCRGGWPTGECVLRP
jgi:hypothetical protein